MEIEKTMTYKVKQLLSHRIELQFFKYISRVQAYSLVTNLHFAYWLFNLIKEVIEWQDLFFCLVISFITAFGAGTFSLLKADDLFY